MESGTCMQDALLSTLNEYKTRYANIIHHHRRRKPEGPIEAEGEREGEEPSNADIEPPLPPVAPAAVGGDATSQFKLSVYNDVIMVEEYDYWMFQAMSRWWYSQSRANVYSYFDREFWSLLRFFEECFQANHTRVKPPAPSEPCLLGECVEFMEELIPALMNLKSVYPDYDGFNELLQDIIDTISVYHETMEFDLNVETRRRLLASH